MDPDAEPSTSRIRSRMTTPPSKDFAKSSRSRPGNHPDYHPDHHPMARPAAGSSRIGYPGVPDWTRGVPGSPPGRSRPGFGSSRIATRAFPIRGGEFPDRYPGVPDQSREFPNHYPGVPDQSREFPNHHPGVPDQSREFPNHDAGVPEPRGGILEHCPVACRGRRGFPDHDLSVPNPRALDHATWPRCAATHVARTAPGPIGR